jgi:pimeloyl-ACP methyl ester carboxylesterase
MSTPASPSDPQLKPGRILGGAFTWTEEGEGAQTIVAVHGLPGSVRDWRWLSSALPRTVRFIRLDMPAFGGTPRETAPGPHLNQRGAFVLEALESLGIEKCVLVGHSMGGPVALSAAANSKGRVAQLALLSSVGLRPHKLLRAFYGVKLWSKAMDTAVIGSPLRVLMRQGFILSGFPKQTTLEEVAHTTRCLSVLDFAAQLHNTTAWKGPTLSAWAEDDTFIEREVFEEHAAALPPGPRLKWAEGGHNIQKTRAVEVAEALVALGSAVP